MHNTLTKFHPHTTLRRNDIILHRNHIIPHSHNTTQRNLSTIMCSTIRHLRIMCREEIEMVIELEAELDEALEEVEDQWYVTNFNNQDIMQGNVHFHQQLGCIVAHRITTRKNVLHYSGRSRKRGTKTTRMFSGFSPKQGMTGWNINIVTAGRSQKTGNDAAPT
jgi:hypothetical protein